MSSRFQVVRNQAKQVYDTLTPAQKSSVDKVGMTLTITKEGLEVCHTIRKLAQANDMLSIDESMDLMNMLGDTPAQFFQQPVYIRTVTLQYIQRAAQQLKRDFNITSPN